MEEIKFMFKTKLEQFEEQHPELYKEIYNIGYEQGKKDKFNSIYNYDVDDNYHFDDNVELTQYEDRYVDSQPNDDTDRYYILVNKQQAFIFINKIISLGYNTTMNYQRFMDGYNAEWYKFFVVFNPMHREFAVETDINVINEYYPNLTNAKEVDIKGVLDEEDLINIK